MEESGIPLLLSILSQTLIKLVLGLASKNCLINLFPSMNFGDRCHLEGLGFIDTYEIFISGYLITIRW